MKKSSLLISIFAITTFVGIIFAQAGGATTVLTVVEKMKAASHDFTLTSELNAGQTDFTSGPLSGKKTGGIVTAEEYNRILEMLSERDSGSNSSGSAGCSTWIKAPTTLGAALDPIPNGLCRFTAQGTGFATDTYYGHVFQNNHAAGGPNSGDVWSCGVDNAGGPNYLTWMNQNKIGTTYTGTTITSTTDYGFEYCVGGNGVGSNGGGSDLEISQESSAKFTTILEAISYCKNLTEGGKTDWRFPSVAELYTFVGSTTSTNYLWSSNMDDSLKTGTTGVAYWTKVRLSDGYFVSTGDNGAQGDSPQYARCVRGGASGGTGGGSNSGSSMVAGWPDAILFDRNGTAQGKTVAYAVHLPSYSEGLYIYEVIDNDATQYAFKYNADGTYNSKLGSLDNLPASEYTKSITQLRAENKAFNFVGGSGSGMSSSWTDVPLTDTANFDTACEYRIFLQGASLQYVLYATWVNPTQLVVGTECMNTSVYSTSKNAFSIWPGSGSCNWTGYALQKIQKRCA